MPTHTVQQGEHLVRIAARYGFPKYEVVWNHPNNAALKALRKNPHVLHPGDQLFIPEKQVKTETRATTQVHHFVIQKPMLKLKLVARDMNDQPIANEQYKLSLDGAEEKKTTTAEGRIDRTIPPDAEHATLEITGIEVPVKIGHLDPIDEVTGQRARLNNLGYNAGAVGEDGPDQFRSAVEEFQCDQALPVTGECDAATQTKLKEVHGC